MRACNVDGCERAVKGKGYCRAHWHRVMKYGDPIADVPIGAGRLFPCGRCEDIEWLADNGDDIDTIAARIITGGNRGSSLKQRREVLRRHLRRHNRTDLIGRLEESR